MQFTGPCREQGPCGHHTRLRVMRPHSQTLGVYCDPVLTVSLGRSTGALPPPVTPGLWDGRTRPEPTQYLSLQGVFPMGQCTRAPAASWFLRKDEEAEKPRKGKSRGGQVVGSVLLLAALVPLSQTASPNL